MTVYAIVAISENGVIGIDNKLPWRLPKDLKWFKMNTNASAVIMGRRTWESLPIKPLPNRLNIILSHEHRERTKNAIWSTSVKDALCHASKHNSNAFVIGGAEIYNTFEKQIDVWLVTHVHISIKSPDVTRYSPPDSLKCIWQSNIFEHNGTVFHFAIYRIKR